MNLPNVVGQQKDSQQLRCQHWTGNNFLFEELQKKSSYSQFQFQGAPGLITNLQKQMEGSQQQQLNSLPSAEGHQLETCADLKLRKGEVR